MKQRRKVRTDTGTKRRGPYKTNPMDTTGKTGKELKPMISFWKKHKVEDIMQLDPDELEDVLEAFLIDYEARQLKRDSKWWYPNLGLYTLNDVRNKRDKKVDKAPRIF